MLENTCIEIKHMMINSDLIISPVCIDVPILPFSRELLDKLRKPNIILDKGISVDLVSFTDSWAVVKVDDVEFTVPTNQLFIQTTHTVTNEDHFSLFYSAIAQSMAFPLDLSALQSPPNIESKSDSPPKSTPSKDIKTSPPEKENDVETRNLSSQNKEKPVNQEDEIQEFQPPIDKMSLSPIDHSLSLDDVVDDDFDFFAKPDVKTPDPNQGAFSSALSPSAPTPVASTPFSPPAQTPYDPCSPQFSPGKYMSPAFVASTPNFHEVNSSPEMQKITKKSRMNRVLFADIMEPRLERNGVISKRIVPVEWLPFELDIDLLKYGPGGTFEYCPNNNTSQESEPVVNQPFTPKRPKIEYQPNIQKTKSNRIQSSLGHFWDTNSALNRKSIELAIEQINQKPCNPRTVTLFFHVDMIFKCVLKGYPEAQLMKLDQFYELIKIEDDYATIGTMQVRKKKRKEDPMLLELATPRIVVHYANSTISTESFSKRFWDVLQFRPIFGHKHIRYIALYPMFDDANHQISNYFSNLKNRYESFGFGNFDPLFPERRNVSVPQVSSLPHLIESYTRLLPSLVDKIVKSLDDNFVLVYLWNPFIDDLSTFLDLSVVFVKLLSLLEPQIGAKINQIYLEIVSIQKMHRITHGLEKMDLFGLYNRIKHKMDDYYIHSPAYLFEQPSRNNLQYSIDDQEPLLVMEPERLIFLFFAQRKGNFYVILTDSTNEFYESRWIFQSLLKQVIEICVQMLSGCKFHIRMIIINVDGWTHADINQLSTVNSFASISLIEIESHLPLVCYQSEPIKIPQPPSGQWQEKHPNSLLFSNLINHEATCWILYPLLYTNQFSSCQYTLKKHINIIDSKLYPLWNQQKENDDSHLIQIIRDVAKTMHTFGDIPWQYNQVRVYCDNIAKIVE